MLQFSSEEASSLKEPSRVSATTGSEERAGASPVVDDAKTYSFAEILEASTVYFRGDTLAANTWATKYALRNLEGNYVEKTPADMHRRLAREFARIELRYKNPMSESEIFSLFDGFKYVVAQGSPMSAVGNPYKLQSVSNCFVVPSPEDSYGGILHTDQQQAQIMKRRGGVGFDISTIRPQGLPTANAAQTTDGIGIFMDRFSNTCREVAQGGRRGALMLTLDVHHPEVRTFINIKRDLKRVTGANISLRLSDEFLTAVRDGREVQLRWPCDPSSKPVVEEWVNARSLWDEIVTAAHACAEPGLLLWDNILRSSPADAYADVGYRTTSTNPCAELPLCPGDSCRLMVVNLASFVESEFQTSASFDWAKFHVVVKKAQRLMDDLVDIELEHVERILAKIDADPESEEIKRSERELWQRIQQTTANGRRTGLGVTAVGDAVAMLGFKYGSDASIEFIEKLYKALAVASYESSIEMAEERGCFPVYDFRKETGHVFVERVLEAAGNDVRRRYEKSGRRNIANLTTAPTGSVSLLTQTSSGIEPVFEVLYTRKKKVNPNDETARVDETDELGDKWTKFTVRHHGLRRWQEVTGSGDGDVDKSPYWGAQAEQIDWVQRVKLQAAAQRWVDHAISSTLNLPEEVTVAEVQKIYMEAWESGCKGITVYRTNSRSGVLVKEEIFAQHSAPKRPDKLPCEVHRTRVKVGDLSEDWIFFIGLLEGKPFEIFGGTTEHIELPKRLQRGTLVKRSFKSGGKYDFLYGEEDDPCTVKDFVRLFNNPNRGWATRMVSLALRHGTPIQYIVEQLQRDKDADMFDFAKSMARILKLYIPDGSKPSTEKVCPECSAEGSLSYQEGCLLCRSCGYSKCG
jgi:ribonucleoside-diphosphate reductase alpha chain